METLVMLNKDDKGLCPKCNEKLQYEKEWDRLYDKDDVNTPQGIMNVERLYNETCLSTLTLSATQLYMSNHK